jgi:hypothetical protein
MNFGSAHSITPNVEITIHGSGHFDFYQNLLQQTVIVSKITPYVKQSRNRHR